MKSYLEPIKFAFLIFPFIAFLITIPYLIYHYHKYGSITFTRSIIVYTFVLYLINIYFLVILPLPSKEAVLMMRPRNPQLIPFHFVVDMMNKTSIVWNDIHSYLAFFKNSAVYTVLFNILLTLPLGIYLRYYFQKKWQQVLVISFSVSFFFEITQLTGLYGIYPRPYRLFDVDDLIMNTLGGIVGCFICPLFTKFLPSREKIDQASYEKGQYVSIYRRMIAYFIDLFFCLSMILILLLMFQTSQIEIAAMIAIISYFVFLPCITNGRTIGKEIVQIKLISTASNHFRLHLLIRQILLHLILLGTPFEICFLFTFCPVPFLCLFLSLILIIYYIKFIFQVFKSLFSKNYLLFYENFTKTKNISTIVIKS